MKPGATNQDFNTDKYNCMQSAMASAPAAVGNAASWNNGGGSANAGPYGGSALWNGGGGAARSYDVNAGNRNELMSACLQSKGWTLAMPKQPNQSASPNNPPAQSYELRLKTEIAQCKRKHVDGVYPTYAETAACINSATVRVMTAAKFPDMDAVYSMNALRSELATKVDNKEMAEDEMQATLKQRGEELKSANAVKAQP